ncbi:MAG TPA: helicase, partial [Leptospiraceae bacterium]|nr:helicase [Leptospiraceae bacterium]
METESVLYQELNRQEIAELKKIAALWNIPKFGGKDKKQSVQQLYQALQDEFLLKGVLEKLTPIQVSILTQILKNKNVQTLGEIIRKVNLPPLNVEMELGVLRKYSLVYQRKNRERLTNNLDKYHAFEEIAGHVKLDTNQKGEKFRLSLEKNYIKPVLKNISHNYIKALGLKKAESENEFYKLAFSDEGISRVLGSLGEFEKDTILHIYTHGGVIESEVLKHYIVVNRGKF